LTAVAAVAAVIAQPSPTPTGGAVPAESVPGEQVCAINDPRLVELSGLVALDDGYAVVNDGTEFGDRVGVFRLDQSCQVIDQIGFPTPSRDPEELAWDREANTLWVGDTGDNFETTGQDPRPSVAFWRIELGGDRTPVIHRFIYPGGPRDAEALLLDGDGTPIIITKSATGTAELFRPEELRPSSGPEDTVPLEPLGEVTLPPTQTEHRLGAVARQVVTGAANAPDLSAVVLRSYTDAFEFDVIDGDLVTALTGSQPRITPLPGEPLGEAIAYSPDGERFLTVSEIPEGDDTGFVPVILSYARASPPPPEPPPEPAAPAAGSGGGSGLFNDVQDIINLIAAVGVLGVLLVAAGVFGIVRSRRGRPDGVAPEDASAEAGIPPATGRVRLPGIAAPPPGGEPATSPAAGVYSSSGARPAGTEYRGTEYGRAPGYPDQSPPGTEYGGDAYRQPDYGGETYHGSEYGDDGYQASGDGYQASGDVSQASEDGYQGSGYSGGYPGSEHGGEGYPGPERGDPYRGAEPRGGGHPAAEHGSADYSRAGYGGGEPRYRTEGGYRQPFDQDWPEGYPDPRPEGYPDPRPEATGYPGAAHQAADYYSDDPDYPYEFRGRDR
jgi:hypothetical protein